eukprot:scaffold596_cov236-Pinguiococcus_pyrenoidosus.AAC.29
MDEVRRCGALLRGIENREKRTFVRVDGGWWRYSPPGKTKQLSSRERAEAFKALVRSVEEQSATVLERERQAELQRQANERALQDSMRRARPRTGRVHDDGMPGMRGYGEFLEDFCLRWMRERLELLPEHVPARMPSAAATIAVLVRDAILSQPSVEYKSSNNMTRNMSGSGPLPPEEILDRMRLNRALSRLTKEALKPTGNPLRRVFLIMGAGFSSGAGGGAVDSAKPRMRVFDLRSKSRVYDTVIDEQQLECSKKYVSREDCVLLCEKIDEAPYIAFTALLPLALDVDKVLGRLNDKEIVETEYTESFWEVRKGSKGIRKCFSRIECPRKTRFATLLTHRWRNDAGCKKNLSKLFRKTAPHPSCVDDYVKSIGGTMFSCDNNNCTNEWHFAFVRNDAEKNRVPEVVAREKIQFLLHDYLEHKREPPYRRREPGGLIGSIAKGGDKHDGDPCSLIEYIGIADRYLMWRHRSTEDPHDAAGQDRRKLRRARPQTTAKAQLYSQNSLYSDSIGPIPIGGPETAPFQAFKKPKVQGDSAALGGDMEDAGLDSLSGTDTLPNSDSMWLPPASALVRQDSELRAFGGAKTEDTEEKDAALGLLNIRSTDSGSKDSKSSDGRGSGDGARLDAKGRKKFALEKHSSGTDSMESDSYSHPSLMKDDSLLGNLQLLTGNSVDSASGSGVNHLALPLMSPSTSMYSLPDSGLSDVYVQPASALDGDANVGSQGLPAKVNHGAMSTHRPFLAARNALNSSQ